MIIRTETRPKIFSNREQALTYHQRQRSKSIRKVATGLFQTHNFAIPTAQIVCATVFPAREVPATFVTRIRVTDVNPTGLVFQLGTALNSLVVWFETTGLNWLAGGGGGTSEVTDEITSAALRAVGAEYEIAVSAIPGAGRFRLYINGIVFVDTATGSGVFPDNEFIGSGDGAFVSTARAGINIAVPAAGQTAPINFQAVQPLSGHVGQRPRGFIA